RRSRQTKLGPNPDANSRAQRSSRTAEGDGEAKIPTEQPTWRGAKDDLEIVGCGRAFSQHEPRPLKTEPGTYVNSHHLDEVLHRFFGFEQFRPGQREVIQNVLDGRNTLGVLRTGLGKSICYQLPSLMLPGITLVISPLISLMQDQIDALHKRGLKHATLLNSSLTPLELRGRYTGIEQGAYKLVYVAPERVDSTRFQEAMRRSGVALLVIDEAHRISQWGHVFRPQYRRLLERLPDLGKTRILALTATATPDVQEDITRSLQPAVFDIVNADFNRP